MTKGRKNRQMPPQQRKGVDLTHVSDASSTTDVSQSRKKKKSRAAYVKVEPPFTGEAGGDKAITWNELGLMWKVGLSIAAFFLAVVLPVVLFATGLNVDVKTLKSDVKEVKEKTDKLGNNSVKHTQRLDGLERSISDINRNLYSNNNRSYNVNEPSKQKKQVKPAK